MISNIHALPYTAGDGKTGQGMANRTRSQVPTQPNLVGNIYNLQKKPRSIKDKLNSHDPWASIRGSPRPQRVIVPIDIRYIYNIIYYILYIIIIYI